MIWKGIKFIITLKNITYSVLRTILKGEKLITNHFGTANIFNVYFSSVADTAKKKIK